MTEPVTVVIPARNAATTIGAQLDALAAQPEGAVAEVIVADNASTDGTREVVARWDGAFERLRIVDAHDRTGPAYARNRAIDAASHELVLGCDADDVVDPHWCRGLAGALRDADLAGGVLHDWDGINFVSPFPLPMGTAGLGYLSACSSANFGVRRSAWQAVGGFDESLPTCEDIDFSWRVQQAGFRFALAPDAVVRYRVPEGRAATLRKWLQYGRFQPTLYRRHRDAGFARQPLARAVAHDGVLALTCFRLAARHPAWRRWCMDAGKRAGRVVGSAEARSLFL